MSNGMKQTEIGEIPVEWELLKLDNLMSLLTDFEANGSFADVKANVQVFDKQNYAWYVRATDLEKQSNQQSVKFVDEHSYSFLKKTTLHGGELLMAKRGEIGKVYFFEIPKNVKATLAPNLYLLKINEKAKAKFLYYYFVSPAGNKTLKRINASSTIGALYKDDVKKLLIPLPPLPEQQKIAEILSTVDEKIAVIDEQLAKTTELKTGLMQRLLTKGVGHTEFKDSPLGEIPVSWEVVNQESVATFHNGRAYKLTEWEKEGTPVIRLQNLTGSGKDYYYSNLKLPEHQYCHSGDLLYMWSATFGPVWWKGEKAIFHYHIWKIEVDKNSLDINYHYYLLNEVTDRMKGQSHGSTMLHVTKGGMEKLLIALPPISEQRRIAQLLITVDDKIQVLRDKKAHYQTLKRGLMQQLLTGKLRVRVAQDAVAV